MAKVKLFTLSTCPWCMKTKKFMKENKVEFEFVDYDLVSPAQQKEIIRELEKLGCAGGFPVVIVDGTVITGYDPDKYKKALKLK